MTKQSPSAPLPDFEKSLQELESIVKKMEDGELTLEQALSQFEQGVNLARQCQSALQSAQLRVEELMNENEGHAS